MSIIVLTKENFEKEVINSDRPVLVDFFATWCGPCKMIAPVLNEIAAENSNYKICKIDVDNEPELAAAFGVSSIPTLVVVKNGKITSQAVGLRPKEAIITMLEEQNV